jgi:hypothetical protein
VNSSAPLALVLATVAIAAPTAIAQRGAAPARSVERVVPAADGRLTIVYSDGTRVPAPIDEHWHREDGPTSYDQPAIADDRQTVGWLVNFKNCCTSYDVPLSLKVFRSGRVIRELGDGFMISEWHFLAGGREVVYHSGTVHGDTADHSTRVDVATGRELAVYQGVLDETAPDWARPPK